MSRHIKPKISNEGTGGDRLVGFLDITPTTIAYIGHQALEASLWLLIRKDLGRLGRLLTKQIAD